MTTLLFVRHGESEANREKFFAGQADVALLPEGEEQAAMTARYIAENHQVSRVYASDLCRAKRTGEIIAEASGAELLICPELREIYAGEWQGKKFDILEEEYRDGYARWRQDIGNCICDGGESVCALAERVFAVCVEIAEKNDGKTVVIATHATPIRAFLCLGKGKRMDDMKNIPWVSNASVTKAVYDNGKWIIEGVGEDAHLSRLRTVLPTNV
ncbi:MAG: histidine phosphatase family protein [Clostridia bacterium]|nr:histidine phosphatase family protein [Clostridia bacterium]